MKQFVFANILEYNLRTLGVGTSEFEMAAWDIPGTDLADLAVFWGGDDTTVLAPQDVDAEWLADIAGTLDLRRLRVWASCGRTRSLCDDIARDGALLGAIRGEVGGALLGAWGPTPQLGTLLRELGMDGHSRTVGLPDVDLFWLAWDLDSKAGFRHFIRQARLEEWVAMPEGFIVPDAETALEATAYFSGQNRGCVLKTAHGTAGFGILRVPPVGTIPERDRVLRELRSRMRFDSGWIGRPIVIEEWITGRFGEDAVSVTADFEVQPDGNTYYLGGGRMRMKKSQYYMGVVCGRGALSVAITERTVKAGAVVGAAVAAHGFRGLFDLDFVVSGDGSVWVTEMNARRASPSHVFAIARRLRGDHWYDDCAVLANDHCTLAGAHDASYRQVRKAIERFQCITRASSVSVIPTIVSSLRRSVPYIGYAVLAEDAERASLAAQEFERLLAEAVGVPVQGHAT